MKIPPYHLAYCTNIHRGETWEETLSSLETHTLQVKHNICPDAPYAIGLRLSCRAATELLQGRQLTDFQHWLDKNECYVFTINGFPYGQFHNTRVKEQVYAPDWSKPERLEYTKNLFRILTEILPQGIDGSVSTLPGSFKEFINTEAQIQEIAKNLNACAQFIEELSSKNEIDLHLGLEPEPLGLFETSKETIDFFNRLHTASPDNDYIAKRLGVNYDTCHLAAEFETAEEALGGLIEAGIRISKIHLSSALELKPDSESLPKLRDFAEDTYLHQVIIQHKDKALTRFKDIDPALQYAEENPQALGETWRVHFHVPIHSQPIAPFGNTSDHINETIKILEKNPSACTHLEMETYTWEVLPSAMRSNDVVEQLTKEYRWTLPLLQPGNSIKH